MFYRRKIILALLERFGGKIQPTDFQKYLFLLSRHQQKASFDFIPYKYGCFSWQSYADMRTMIKYGQVADEKGWEKKDRRNYINEIKPIDSHAIDLVFNRYAGLNGNNLVRKVYQDYPYYAIKSEIAKKILSAEDYEGIKQYIPKNNELVIYSIGYEGCSFDNYLNALIKEDVKCVVDVRKRPLSMKYGFSKKQLHNGLESIGIEYKHSPNLGIASDKRKELNNQKDYDILFAEYKKTVLRDNANEVRKIFDLFVRKERIALTCFEKNTRQCHRTEVLNAICRLDEWDSSKYRVKEI